MLNPNPNLKILVPPLPPKKEPKTFPKVICFINQHIPKGAV